MGNKASKPRAQSVTLQSPVFTHAAAASTGPSAYLDLPGSTPDRSLSTDALQRSRGASTSTNVSRRSFAGTAGPAGVHQNAVPPMPLPLGVSAMGIPTVGGPPPKFITDASGVRRLNPAYLNDPSYAAPAGQPAITIDVAEALPVCCSLAEHAEHMPMVPLAPTVTATVAVFEDPHVSSDLGLSPQDAMRQLGAVFEKYQTPMGLVNKLTLLSELDGMDFIIDDSGSMGLTGSLGGTRWDEVQVRLKQMFEILAHVPFPPITIRFLNSKKVVEISRKKHETPASVWQRCIAKIDKHLASMQPKGSTPAFEAISESLARNPDAAVARYFFGDGLPNGGARDEARITKLLCLRKAPHRNPFTFISCTQEDDQTRWMKEAEETAPYCAEYDDLMAEVTEVRGDQGAAFPYTTGLYLICQLVGAMCPDDLDAIDESVPLTKTTLENILGYQLPVPEYKHYFDDFIIAQQRRLGRTSQDAIKRQMNWARLFTAFSYTPLARSIPEVQEYKRQLQLATLL
jgi:hypothetical protein